MHHNNLSLKVSSCTISKKWLEKICLSPVSSELKVASCMNEWTCLTPRYRAGCENWGQVQFRGWRLACCPCVLRFPLAGGGERSAVMALQRDPWLQPSFHPATVTKLTFSSQGKPVRPWCTLLNWPLHCFGCSNGGSNFVHMHYKGSP